MPTKQFLMSGTKDDPITTSTQYSSLLGDGNWAWVDTEEYRTSPISTPGKFSNFQVGVGVAPGNGKSWVFTIRKAASGQAMADTDLSVTIADTAVLSSLDADEVVVAAGERVSISATSIEVPTPAGAVYWTCQFTPDTDGKTILLSNTGGSTLGNFTRYNTLIGGKAPDSTRFDGQTLFPTAGTLKKLYIELVTAPGADTSRIFTIEKNGDDTGLVATISNAATTGNDTDSDHNVTIAAGDLVTIQSSLVGAPAASAVKFGIVFLPDTQGEYIASATTDDVTSSAAVEYQHLNCGDSTLNGTETEVHCLAQETLAKKTYVNLGTAPGNGSSWIFTLREALGDTALTVTISNTDTNGNAATDEAIAADALVDTSIDATAGALTSKTQIAYLFYNAPIGGQDYPISLSPGLTASATVAYKVAFDRGMSPGLTASAAIARALAWDRATTPNLTVAVTVAKSLGRLIATSTALAVSATISRKLAYTRAVTSNLIASSTVAYKVAYKRVVSSGLTATVTVARLFSKKVATISNLAVSTTVSRVVAYNRSTQTALSMAVSILKSWGRAISTSTALAVSTTINRIVAKAITTTTGLTVSTSVARTLAYNRTLTPGLTVSATVSRAVAYLRATQPALSVAVTVVKGWGRTITTSAGLTISTTIARAVAYYRATSPGLTISAFFRLAGQILRVMVITTQYRQVQLVTAQYRLVQAITSQYRKVVSITGQYRLVKVITALYRKIRVITSGG